MPLSPVNQHLSPHTNLGHSLTHRTRMHIRTSEAISIICFIMIMIIIDHLSHDIICFIMIIIIIDHLSLSLSLSPSLPPSLPLSRARSLARSLSLKLSLSLSICNNTLNPISYTWKIEYHEFTYLHQQPLATIHKQKKLPCASARVKMFRSKIGEFPVSIQISKSPHALIGSEIIGINAEIHAQWKTLEFLPVFGRKTTCWNSTPSPKAPPFFCTAVCKIKNTQGTQLHHCTHNDSLARKMFFAHEKKHRSFKVRSTKDLWCLFSGTWGHCQNSRRTPNVCSQQP